VDHPPSGTFTLGPDAEVLTAEFQSPVSRTWIKIAPGVFAEYEFDRSDFDAAVHDSSAIDGSATGRVSIVMGDAERME
jgi:hypothetical protein